MMSEKETSLSIQKLLDENGCEIKVEVVAGHLPTYHAIDPLVLELVKSTLKFNIIIAKKNTL